jgi:hypothetical protein
MQRKEPFYANQWKERPGRDHFEQREESPLKKYGDSSGLRLSALHDGLAECFNNRINGT